MRKTTLAWIVLLAALAPAAWAQDLESHPGYADLTLFDLTLGGEVTFDVDFDQQNLAALVGLSRPDDEPLAALIDRLESVRARVVELDADQAEVVRDSLVDAAAQLKGEGWSTLVSVRDGSDRVELLLRLDHDRILGVAALFAGDDEAGFANVVGDVEMAQVLALMSNLGSLRRMLYEMEDLGEADG